MLPLGPKTRMLKTEKNKYIIVTIFIIGIIIISSGGFMAKSSFKRFYNLHTG